jgi:hypothetical protein
MKYKELMEASGKRVTLKTWQKTANMVMKRLLTKRLDTIVSFAVDKSSADIKIAFKLEAFVKAVNEDMRVALDNGREGFEWETEEESNADITIYIDGNEQLDDEDED